MIRQVFLKNHCVRPVVALGLLAVLSLGHSACFLDEKVEPYYGRVEVTRPQVFNWSDGGLPQTFDPAFAAAPPDTDLIRAVFEGLTDYDPRTLTPIPAVATRWEESDSGRVWTFYLRDDARWSNGDEVTASDFVRSWQRTVRIGDLAPHTELLANIEGAGKQAAPVPSPPVITTPSESQTKTESTVEPKPEPARGFGVEAISKRVLRVRLRRPDMNFPALVAHPVFRPVKVKGEESLQKLTPNQLISNGAFSLAGTDQKRVSLERANTYWDKAQVALDRVVFVDAGNAESALAAYRAGEVDAVTNAAFEPLAIKLLTPYEDFRRTTYGALTYYSFNTAHEPFDDVRVREALALAIDRDRISEDYMGGATEPAKRFLPHVSVDPNRPVIDKSELLEKDHERARTLLAEAGFPDGEGFPRIKLLINRNDQQRIVAQAVAGMWKNVLNVNTELIIRGWEDYEAAIKEGNFDVVRRGVVMQTTDELTNIRMVFQGALDTTASVSEAGTQTPGQPPVAGEAQSSDPKLPLAQSIETERQALNDLTAMPIYFASSYALVKPYVRGFESNILDAPSLKTVRIDSAWKPPSDPAR